MLGKTLDHCAATNRSPEGELSKTGESKPDKSKPDESKPDGSKSDESKPDACGEGPSQSNGLDVVDPFLQLLPNIMIDVKESVTRYSNELTEKVLEHAGGADITSYLGHIFSTGLNFQTSMWQLLMSEAVYLPTITHEQLCREASTLRLFVQCIPMFTRRPAQLW